VSAGSFATIRRVYRVNEALVVHDTIDDEVLVIRNDTGTYYSLLGPSADIWAGVRAGLDPAGISGLLATRYDADLPALTPAVDQLLAELLEAKLICAGTADGSAVELPGPLDPRLAFTAPCLEEYTDMSDLLLFDPIHEVTPDGWPNVTDAQS
jgi:hypothetical protein